MSHPMFGVPPLVEEVELNMVSRHFRGPRSSALVLRLAVIQRSEENHFQQESVWPATDWTL